ncbi:FG-GAP-like repeat-containing protein [Sanyastnella coralliicola]|uniref:FG-GAP-like repeat-containing protein n=1 Tax=Sanyastnella coralliicola TaxID=3069118 RepID=UPI0027B97A9D|nr:FG-GAP-like repeat-containing protein [Longitalea sp. SCSIO 12813]
MRALTMSAPAPNLLRARRIILTVSFFFAAIFFTITAFSQSFTDASANLPSNYNSGGTVGVTDMNNDGLDDIVTLDQADHLKILYQTAGGWVEEDYGVVSGNNQWGFAVGDLNNDGHNDVISGGAYDGVHFVSIDAQGISTMSNLANGSMFMQDCNMADIDNDGYLDYFACHDDAASRIWHNDGAGGMVPNTTLIDFTDYDYGGYNNTDHSGNYGSVWSDFDDDGDLDLFIAKCRQFVNDPNDPRRINQLWVNDGNGNFTEEAAARGLVLNEQSWTADFADYDNDGDMDCLITNHSTNMMLLENDGTGNFTDVTAAAGVSTTGFFLQAKMADLDNDGYNDIVYAGGVHRYYHNNGDGTFSYIANTFPYGDTMHSFGIGDLNNDGSLDLYSSYGNGYVNPDNSNDDILWLNDGNSNNWVVFDLEGIISNANAVGAKIKIYGDWGVQVREVRAGESYGIVNTFHAHFGLGSSTSIDSVVIDWPSGTQTVINDPAINTYNNVLEAECQLAGITVTANGGTGLCPGETVELTAPAGYDVYDWNNGESTQSIIVSAAGNYSVNVYDTDGCIGISNSVLVEEITPVVPTIAADGDLTFCEGSSVTLTASEGTSYNWSNGEDTQSIVVTAAGSYSVGVVDVCASETMSEAIEVSTLNTPDTPAVMDVDIPAPGTADVSWMGDNVQWYDDEFANAPIATGNDFTTPVVNDQSTFWVDDFTLHGGATGNGGKPGITNGSGQYHFNSSYWLEFDAAEDIIIDNVRVFANGAGDRGIEVIDDQGTVIASGTFNLPDGESVVTLDFFVPQGTGYGLRSTNADPQLWRDSNTNEIQYPYDLNGLATITSSSIDGANALNFYYFFYDWNVSTPSTECTTARTSFTVTVAGVEGCTNPSACNYDPEANEDDGSCEFLSCQGCTDANACNYDATATVDNGSCTYAVMYYMDGDMDGFGAGAATPFCDDPGNGWSLSDQDCDDSLDTVYPGAPGTAEGIDNNCNGSIDPTEEIPADCPGDFDGDGLVTAADLLVMLGDYGCLADCVADLDGDGEVSTSDILAFFSAFGTICD